MQELCIAFPDILKDVLL